MDMERELLKGNTPTLVLAILRDAPLHGYAIAREIERRSASRLKFKDGTLYPTLQMLEGEKFIVSKWEHSGSGPARKVYSLTKAGSQELERRTHNWRSFVAAVGSVLGESVVGGGPDVEFVK